VLLVVDERHRPAAAGVLCSCAVVVLGESLVEVEARAGVEGVISAASEVEEVRHTESKARLSGLHKRMRPKDEGAARTHILSIIWRLIYVNDVRFTVEAAE
jgi:hypothetical protein